MVESRGVERDEAVWVHPSFEAGLAGEDTRQDRGSTDEASAIAGGVDVQRDFIQEIQRLPVERRQLVYRIRRQLAEGSYETEDKLEIALARLLFDLGEKEDLLDDLDRS